jgi:hypothetical protein
VTYSLLMNVAAYLFTAHAFRSSAPLSSLTAQQAVWLVIVGLGGALVQLPVIGWMTQVAASAAVLHAVFGVDWNERNGVWNCSTVGHVSVLDSTRAGLAALKRLKLGSVVRESRRTSVWFNQESAVSEFSAVRIK